MKASRIKGKNFFPNLLRDFPKEKAQKKFRDPGTVERNMEKESRRRKVEETAASEDVQMYMKGGKVDGYMKGGKVDGFMNGGKVDGYMKGGKVRGYSSGCEQISGKKFSGIY